ncbi:Cellulose synthase operon protein D [Pigmentiphaga humi]|uniref:Cellulose synthase operon protein D n=1 Tax=Pigmentiphaga humi TaxID=2478468 RepID=A0A3P4B567_9BURK|nr:cellulose biosynthesis protein BcsD [Pigmentiphaga humi]VCU70676.1 Cellulose synthase operon protein D [Pigmentiphaga humi]
MDATSSVISYLAARQCSSQWKAFLRSTAGELADKLAPAELSTFMRRVGNRFARELPLPACATLDEIQLAMSETWTRLDWGWVEISDENDHLGLCHYCSPLAVALGSESLAWGASFLEGVYQQWFEQLGASARLRVSLIAGAVEPSTIQLRLGAPVAG